MENQTVQQPAADTNNESKPLEGEFYSGKDMFELEKERIKSSDKRTEIARLAIEANDSSDKRQFEYHMSKLASEANLKDNQNKMASNLLYFGGTFICIIIGLMFYMSFFGDSHQSQIASDLLEKLITALGGIGVFLLGKGIFNKLTRLPEE